MKQTDQDFMQPIIYQQEEDKPTMMLVFKKKFFTWLEKNRFSKFVFKVLYFLLAVGISALLIFPKETASMILAVILFHNAAAPKIIFSFFIVFEWSSIRKKLKKRHNQHTIEGIPQSELLHFLFKTNGFKLKEFMNEFGLSQKVHIKIAKQLEQIGILVRGENNARILSRSISMRRMKEILASAKTAKDLSHFRVNSPDNPEPRNPQEIQEDLDEIFEEEEVIEEEIKRASNRPFVIRQLS